MALDNQRKMDDIDNRIIDVSSECNGNRVIVPIHAKVLLQLVVL